MVKVSVIMTVKNGQEFIKETIDSIINQSFKDWEFIIVNDGSSDNTNGILENYINIKKIKVIKTTGIGRGKALNLAIENSKGDYIANIDADDPAHFQRIEIQYKIAKSMDEQGAWFSDFYILNKNQKNEVFNKEYINFTDVEIKDITLTKEHPFFKQALNHSTFFIKKELLNKIGNYDESRKSLFDYELWLRFSFNNIKINYIPLKLNSKRIHDAQSFEAKKRVKYLKDTLVLNEQIIEKFNLGIKAKLIVYIKFLYGLLPREFRKIIKKFLISI